MTVELFRLDPYCSSFRAQVARLGTDFVVLDQTHFFPTSVEQMCDVGRIEEASVLSAQRIGNEIRHILDDVTGFAIGDSVQGELNWPRRYRTMRLHTAQHLLQLALFHTHDIATCIGGEIGPNRASVDFLPLSPQQPIDTKVLARWMESSVHDRLPTIHASDATVDQRRHWHIDGLASIACNGTHVRSTAEVGAVEITQVRTASAIMRLEVELVSD